MSVIEYLKTLPSDEVAVFFVKLMGNYMCKMYGTSPLTPDEEFELMDKVNQVLNSSAVVKGKKEDISNLN